MTPSSPSEDVDWSALQRLADGEHAALNEIIARWKQPIANFIFQHVYRDEIAVDLAQETFIRVYDSCAKTRPNGKFSTWLFTIAINLVRNHARWQSRHPAISLDDEFAASIESSTPPPDTQIQQDEKNKLVQKAVSALPEDLREVLVLFEYHDFSYEEIATILHVSRKTVETRLYRARNILREKLVNLLD